MKAVNSIRKIDSHGRVVLPKELRDAMGWHEDSPVGITKVGNTLVLEKHSNAAYEKERIAEGLNLIVDTLPEVQRIVVERAIDFLNNN